MLRKGLFYIEGMHLTEHKYTGYTDGDLWNGWSTPRFTKEEALKIADAFSEVYKAEYDAAIDSFTFTYDEPETFAGIDEVIDGETVRLYPIGTWGWIWDEVKPDIITLSTYASCLDDEGPGDGNVILSFTLFNLTVAEGKESAFLNDLEALLKQYAGLRWAYAFKQETLDPATPA